MDFDFALLDIQLPDGSGLELPKPETWSDHDKRVGISGLLPF
jgi:hypothetical protein